MAVRTLGICLLLGILGYVLSRARIFGSLGAGTMPPPAVLSKPAEASSGQHYHQESPEPSIARQSVDPDHNHVTEHAENTDGAGSALSEPEQSEEDFKWLRETTDSETLRQEIADLESQIVELCSSEAFARLAEGEYEVLPPEEQEFMPLRRERMHLVEFYSTNDSGEKVRVVMPRGKHADAYALKQKQIWLHEVLEGRRSIERGQ